MRRLFEISRYAVIIPSAASIIGAIVLMILGSIEIVRSAIDVVLKQVPLKETVVAILTSVDAILLAMAYMNCLSTPTLKSLTGWKSIP
jgi:hypothetical protein